MELKIINELLRLLRKRSKHFESEARTASTDELYTIYRAKAAEAESVYIILMNMKLKAMKGGGEG